MLTNGLLEPRHMAIVWASLIDVQLKNHRIIGDNFAFVQYVKNV